MTSTDTVTNTQLQPTRNYDFLYGMLTMTDCILVFICRIL